MPEEEYGKCTTCNDCENCDKERPYMRLFIITSGIMAFAIGILYCIVR